MLKCNKGHINLRVEGSEFGGDQHVHGPVSPARGLHLFVSS